MIKITSLNKIYKSKKRKICHAVKNINLTLPDTGLVFVLGKSGSGKSTLLNLIGGLDNLSGGSIIVDGNDLSCFSESRFCDYRNSHVGFIFQDYHLIDELTVYENIVLSLNLRRMEDKELVSAALAKVDLAGYEDRYPTELSGGEQQRVAIARAIVKKPRIILADEPTGNLDTHTARAIVELLKELSRDCLILIVSHNVNDANSYADRIIELKKGEIISDKSRNPDFADCVTLQDGMLVYPKDTYLSDGDIELMNNNKSAQIIKRRDKFVATPESKIKTTNIKIERKTLSLGRELGLSGRFLKNKSLVISLSAFMVAVIMTILALAQTIAAFDGGHIIADEMAKGNQESILMNKVLDDTTSKRVDGNFHIALDEADIQRFYDEGYNGSIYPVLNVTLPVTVYSSYCGKNASHFNGCYLNETFGTMIVDEAFLKRQFGEDIYAARLDEFEPHGIIITDYVADSIIETHSKYKGKTYEDLLGEINPSIWECVNFTVNGIINTGYKERHSGLFDKISNGEFANNSEMLEDELFIEFVNEAYKNLGYSYSINPNFANDYCEKVGKQLLVSKQKIVINDVFVLGQLGASGEYFCVDNEPNNTLRDAWRYTVYSPKIPEGAKYMRVAFGTTQKDFNVDDDPLYYLFAMKQALLIFSDGSSPSTEQLNFERGKGLGTSGETVEDGWACTSSLLSDYIEIPEGAQIEQFATYTVNGYAFCSFYDENKKFIGSYTTSDREPLPEDSIIINYEQYNDLFGTDYTPSNLDSFIPHTVKLTQYRQYDVDMQEPLFSDTVTIIGLRAKTTTACVSENIGRELVENDLYYSALYFDGTEGIGAVLNLADELNYEPQSYAVEGIHSMTRAVDVFVPIFEFISIFLYIGVIFILMNFATKTINDKMHEIGILKAIGTKNGTIGVVFGLQVMLIAILTCGLSTLGYYLFIDMANDILIESIRRIAPGWNLPELQFLVFEWEIALMNCALTLGLALVSLIAPMIKIKAIKPVKIIKAKE